MWDRFRQKGRVAPSLNRKKLEAWQDAHSSPTPSSAAQTRGVKGGNGQYQYAVKGGQSPRRLRRKDVGSQENAQRPSAAYMAVPSIREPSTTGRAFQRDPAYGRSLSSVYSQPSQAASFAAGQLRNGVARPNLEISPPSSPDIGPHRDGPNSGDVSPIDEAPDTFGPDQTRHAAPTRTEPRSNIPTMRRERMKNSDAALSSLNPATLRARLRPVRQPSPGLQPEPAPRPEWRGASGRTVIVPPVRDDMRVAPLNIPPKSSKRDSRSLQGISSVDFDNASQVASLPSQIKRRLPSPIYDNDAAFSAVGSSTRKPSHSPDAAPDHHSSPLTSAYPTSALRPGQSPVQETPLESESSLQRMASNAKALRRKPTRMSLVQHLESSTLSERSQHDTPAQAPTDDASERIQPQSRFSITTCATSDRSVTPRASFGEDAPPTPTPTTSPVRSKSILDRGRPVVAGFEKPRSVKLNEPVKISLDSPYYTVSSATTGLRALASKVVPQVNKRFSVVSTLPNDKLLPPAPPEASARDRVAELNAQLGALGNRRINLNIAIRQMTQMMPMDHVLASEAVVRKREAEKRKVEVLRTELAEVERRSYELGLRLHRAYKRLDRDAEYEPTTLWVRRVTN